MRTTATAAPDHPQRARVVADVGRRLDDLYAQLDLHLTHMAQIQLQFDALRAKVKLL